MKFRYNPNTEKLIVSESTMIEYHQIKIWLERFVKGHRFLPAVKMGIWSGKQSYFDNGKVNLGLWRECFKACKEIGSSFNIENKEDFPINKEVTLLSVQDFCAEFFKDHKVKDSKTSTWVPFMPYDYQIETAYKILKNRYCLAEVATSGGKSLIITIVILYTLKYIKDDAKFLIIVPSISLVTQFYDGIKEYYYGENNINNVFDYNVEIEMENGTILTKMPNDKIMTKNRGEINASELTEKDRFNKVKTKKISKIKIDEYLKIEEIMSDHPRKLKNGDDPNIYIGCYQSLEKWPKEFFKQFHTVSCDEAHGCKSTTLTTILKRTFGHAFCRFGVSGTFPGDDTLEILTIQSVLGPKVTQIEASTLVEAGTITPMNVKALILNHDSGEFNERLSYIKKMGGGANAFIYEKEFIQNSEKRLEFIKKLVGKCNENTLLLFHTIEHGKRLLDKLKAELPDKEFYYIDGDVNNKERTIIKAQMELSGDKVKVLIASYGTLSTGVSIKNLHYLILADSFKSEGLVVQSIGRVLRNFTGKSRAIIFDIVDVFDEKMNNILYNHFKERMGFYNKRKYPLEIKKIKL
jgi:superfamily II DNA or RNA helicase